MARIPSGFEDEAQAPFVMDGPRLVPPSSREVRGTTTATVRLGPGGRVVIPAEMRDAMGLKQGDEMVAHLEDGRLTLMTVAETVRQLQAAMAKLVPDGVSLSEELLADRRREVAEDTRD